jgi:hypothetical protein
MAGRKAVLRYHDNEKGQERALPTTEPMPLPTPFSGPGDFNITIWDEEGVESGS